MPTIRLARLAALLALIEAFRASRAGVSALPGIAARLGLRARR
jgi:hypothetical protein